MQKDLSPRGITRFVGRAEVAEALGYSLKTLGREINRGHAPRPVQISPNRVGWPVEVIQKLLESRIARVTEQAVSNPDKLKPDQIEDAAVKLSARLMTNVLGEAVSADNVVIGAVKQLSPDDADTATNSQWLALWLAVEDRMSALDEKQSLAVVYGLFPVMRPFLEGIAAKAGKRICPPDMPPIDLALCTLAGPGWDAFRAWAQEHNKRASST
jgi:predicted DNA-binding transcriptional regulator AlpA